MRLIVVGVVTFVLLLFVGGVSYILGYSQLLAKVSPPTASNDCVKFISDVTIENGSILPAGSTQDKTWHVQNCGTTTWDGYQLKRRYGTRFTQPSVDVPPLRPGEEGDVTISITVPQEAGGYGTFFDIARKDEQRDILLAIFSVR